jgi:hypothetical protein
MDMDGLPSRGPENIVIDCSPETKMVWQTLLPGYESKAALLGALLRAYENEPRDIRSTAPRTPSSRKRAGSPRKRIRIKLGEELRERWLSMNDGYENYEDQLRALMSAYSNTVSRCAAVRVEL